MKKKLFKILLFAVVTLLVGCGKKPAHYLVVRGYTPAGKDSISGVRNAGNTVDLKLYSIEYGLDYRGEFEDCATEDPLLSHFSYSGVQSLCSLPPPNTSLLVTQEDCDGGFGLKCTYVIYTETRNSRQVKTAFQIYPNIN